MSNTKQVIRCLSMGAGIQTTALLILNRDKYDFIAFVDLGDEDKRTYYYIEKYLKPFCKENGLEWVTLYPKKPLYQHCMDKKIIPIRARRWCTQDFKIEPLNKFYRSLGATAKDPVYADIGISWDEAERSNMQGVLYVKREFPLVDSQKTRKDCEKIIINHGWPLPPKSGCVYCPHQNRKKILELKVRDPETFQKLIILEKNSYDYPKRPLVGKFTLESLEMNQSLDQFADNEEDMDGCETGYCFH